MIKLSISIVCFNSPPEQLSLLMQSIIDSVRFMRPRLKIATIPIFLIDNSNSMMLSLDDFSRFQSDFDELLIQKNHLAGHGNIGYGSGHNLVLDQVDSDFHLILNPDVILQEDALYLAIELLASDTRRKMLGPNAIRDDGQKQYLCKRYPSIFTLLLRALLPSRFRKIFSKRLDHYEMRDLPEDRVTDDIPLLSGCFMLVDTPTFRKVKGFDKRYFLYFEDFDLSLRVKKFGTLAYAPLVRISHSGGEASTKGLWHIVIFSISAIRFFGNHGLRVF